MRISGVHDGGRAGLGVVQTVLCYSRVTIGDAIAATNITVAESSGMGLLNASTRVSCSVGDLARVLQKAVRLHG